MIVKGGFVHVAFALIKRITIENMSEQELMDEITNRMCMMDFSREQIEEITKSLDAHMKLSILLSYLYPTTSAEEMAKKRNEHLSKRD
ncbi:MAG: hypothetical protein ACLTTO_07430 [Lachnospiraceae bacterium]